MGKNKLVTNATKKLYEKIISKSGEEGIERALSKTGTKDLESLVSGVKNNSSKLSGLKKASASDDLVKEAQYKIMLAYDKEAIATARKMEPNKLNPKYANTAPRSLKGGAESQAAASAAKKSNVIQMPGTKPVVPTPEAPRKVTPGRAAFKTKSGTTIDFKVGDTQLAKELVEERGEKAAFKQMRDITSSNLPKKLSKGNGGTYNLGKEKNAASAFRKAVDNAPVIISKPKELNRTMGDAVKSGIYKAAAVGIGAGMVFNMFDNKGQQSNTQLYGQQQSY